MTWLDDVENEQPHDEQPKGCHRALRQSRERERVSLLSSLGSLSSVAFWRQHPKRWTECCVTRLLLRECGEGRARERPARGENEHCTGRVRERKAWRAQRERPLREEKEEDDGRRTKGPRIIFLAAAAAYSRSRAGAVLVKLIFHCHNWSLPGCRTDDDYGGYCDTQLSSRWTFRDGNM